MNQITNYIIEEKEFDAACPEEKIMNRSTSRAYRRETRV